MDASDTSDGMDTSFPLNDSLEVDSEHLEEESLNIHRLRQCVDSGIWTDVSSSAFTELRLCKMSTPPTGSSQPPIITHYLVIHADLTWSVSIHNHPLNLNECTILKNIPQRLCCDSLKNLLL